MSFFTTGGTVQAGEGIYLQRPADTELLQLCQASQFAYILTARQMGKSSLMGATAESLQQQNILSLVIDLQSIGIAATVEQWYLGLLIELEKDLEENHGRSLSVDLWDWWQQNNALGMTQRFTMFFREVLLKDFAEPIVVFVDEIDTTLGLNFTDDFFIAIRYFYTARSQNPEFQRLSFVLLGAAMPGDLIKDSDRTPFNIGQRLDLEDFSLTDAYPLAKGLPLPDSEAKQVLSWVLAWTGGHPYLTQRLCQLLVEEAETLGKGNAAETGGSQRVEVWTKAGVERVVQNTFLKGGDHSDRNLQFVRNLLTQPTAQIDREDLLRVYREIWKGKVVEDDERSLIKSHLKLSGVVKQTADRKLAVRNKLYRQVFDRKWIKANFPESWVQRYWPVLRIAMPATVVSLLAAIAMGSLFLEANRQRVEAERQRRIAQVQTSRAQANASESSFLAQRPLDGMIAAVESFQSLESKYRKDPVINLPARTALLRGVYQLSTQGTSSFKQNLAYSFREKNILQGHDDSVASVVAAPDNTIVTASVDGTVKLWDVQGNEINSFDAHTSISNIALSPDGNTIAAAGLASTVKLWDVQGNEINSLEGHNSFVLSVAFSPDGNTIATASADHTVRLWDRAGKEINTLSAERRIMGGYLTGFYSVAFSPDGNTIAAVSSDRDIIIWNMEGDELNTIEAHRNTFEARNADRGDGTMEILDMAFSPDGNTIATASDDHTVELWNMEGRNIGTFEGHRDGIWSVAFSSSGDTLATASADGTVKLWNLEGNELATIEGNGDVVHDVEFSPDGKNLITGSSNGDVKVWDLRDKFASFLAEHNAHEGHRDSVLSVAFSPDGNIIATTSVDGTVKLRDMEGKDLGMLKGHRDSVLSVAFSPNGQKIATTSVDGTVKLWSAKGDELYTLESDSSSILSVAFSPDGNKIATASDDSTVQLWDTNGKETNTVKINDVERILTVGFSLDNKVLITENDDGRTVNLWNLAGKKIGTLIGHRGRVLSTAFSSDRSTIATTSHDYTVKLWELGGNKLDKECENWDRRCNELNMDSLEGYSISLEGHSDSVLDVTFSPDGNTLATASQDGTVKLWDMEGNELNTLEGHSNSVLSVAFSPDGNTLATASQDGTVKLWELDPQKLMNWSCTWLQDYLRYNPEGKAVAAEGVCQDYL
ncbi:MAG: AAA-like domain-containing protein [Cyanobacteria bacterium P01_F01_bin.86]